MYAMIVPRIRATSCIVLTVVLALFTVTATQAANWYLDKAASGANNGTSATNAWNSLASMNLSVIQSGDTLLINGGDYSTEELGMYFPGKSNITFKVYPTISQQAVFRAIQLYDARGCLLDGYLNGTQYIKVVGKTTNGNGVLARLTSDSTIRGIEVDGAAINSGNAGGEQHGIALNGDVYRVVIENCYVHHIYTDGISSNTSPPQDANTFTNVIIRNNRIYYVGDDGIQSGVGNLTVYGNDVDQGGAPLYLGAHPDGIQINPGRRNVIIAGNTFKGFNQNIFVEFGAAEIYIYNNVVMGSGSPGGTERGMLVSTTTPFAGTFLIANNTFYNFTSFIAIVGGLVPTGNRVLANNLFINCQLGALSTDQYLVDNTSVWYDLPGVQFYNTDGTPIGPPSPRYFGAATNINPSLMNILGLDFRPLNGSSPVVLRGTNLSSYFSTDRNGSARAGAGAWDIGAFVLSSPVIPTPVTPPPPPAPVVSVPSNARTSISVN